MSKHVFALLLDALEEEYGKVTQTRLAGALSVTQPTISNWKNGATPSKSNLRKLLEFYREHHASSLVKPILEFSEIEPTESGNSYSFFPAKDSIAELRAQLIKRRGIYVYYDSSGRAIYLGKSESCIFTEAKQRLTAEPNRQFYMPAKTGHGWIGEYARYISAYEVAIVSAIKNIETFMLRSFPNDLMNKNSGNFGKLLRK